MFTYAFNVYDIYVMEWYIQVELVLAISVLTRKLTRYLNNKIDLAVFQEGEEGELKSENILTKNSSFVERGPGPFGLGLL